MKESKSEWLDQGFDKISLLQKYLVQILHSPMQRSPNGLGAGLVQNASNFFCAELLEMAQANQRCLLSRQLIHALTQHLIALLILQILRGLRTGIPRCRKSVPAVIPYTGQMGAAAKVAALDRFRQEGGVLLCTEVGGQGLNLQNCRTVVNYDIPWNPMRLEQRVGRVHRYGQKFTTRIVHFVSPGTFEAHIFDVLTRKLGLFRQVIGEVEAILSFLEEDEGLQQMLTHAVCLSADDADMERRFEELRLRVDLARSRYERSVQTTVALLDGEV